LADPQMDMAAAVATLRCCSCCCCPPCSSMLPGGGACLSMYDSSLLMRVLRLTGCGFFTPPDVLADMFVCCLAVQCLCAKTMTIHTRIQLVTYLWNVLTSLVMHYAGVWHFGRCHLSHKHMYPIIVSVSRPIYARRRSNLCAFAHLSCMLLLLLVLLGH
jgi:hypothetical protein